MADSLMAMIKDSCVDPIELAHSFGEIRLWGLHQQMEAVVH
ncbi:MAG: hypothetical protein U0223_14600 [Nitrospira sp.]